MKIIVLTLLLSISSVWAQGKYSSEDYIICDIEESAWPGFEVLYPQAPEAFIHCARPSQILAVMNQFFTADSYRMFVTTKDKIASLVIYEGNSYATLYPHIYGPLYLNEIIYSFNVKRNANGKYDLPKVLEKSPR